jgi:hypothetical protein
MIVTEFLTVLGIISTYMVGWVSPWSVVGLGVWTPPPRSRICSKAGRWVGLYTRHPADGAPLTNRRIGVVGWVHNPPYGIIYGVEVCQWVGGSGPPTKVVFSPNHSKKLW